MALIGRPFFNQVGDIIGGLTIATNDIWAYRVEIVEYELTGNYYKGHYKLTLFDHFGLDEADVDNCKNYGYLAGFRAWFILQHLDRFAFKPFITVMEMEVPFIGTLYYLFYAYLKQCVLFRKLSAYRNSPLIGTIRLDYLLSKYLKCDHNQIDPAICIHIISI